MSRKRSSAAVEDFDDVASIVHGSPNAKVCGVVTELSPMKRGRSCTYYDGELSDGRSKVRLFGFDAKSRESLNTFYEKKEGVAISSCEVKSSRSGGNFELLVRKQSTIEKSTKEFDCAEISKNAAVVTSSSILLDGLPILSDNQRVDVKVKVLRLSPVTEVNNGKKKQDAVVADSAGVTRIVLWEQDIGCLVVDKSYVLTGLTVRSYAGETYLSMPKKGSTIEECDDVGDVVDEDDDVRVSEGCELSDAVVVGIEALTQYNSCLKCTAKVLVEAGKPGLGRCGKCGMLQRVDGSAKQWSATLIVKAGQRVKTLKAFGSTLSSIVGSDGITEEELLFAEPFSVSVSAANVMLHVSRERREA